MNKDSSIRVLQDSAPKVFVALGRFMTPVQLEQIAGDYHRCAEHGGNAEPELVREEGVSFNPRLARVLSLLVSDGGVRQEVTLRAALYATCLAVMGNGGVGFTVPHELSGVVAAVREASPSVAEAALIRGVIELDTIRHLHQSSLSRAERIAILADQESVLRGGLATVLPEWLRLKLDHALVLQRRHVEQHGVASADSGE